MKTITTIFILLFSTLMPLSAEEPTGESIYQANCVACHTLKNLTDMSNEERAEMMKTMKAPPMPKVSAQLKNAFDHNETKFRAFVEDYIQNPDANKSLCAPMAVKRFGVMPAIEKLSEEERKVIAKWLYENFDEKEISKNGEACNAKDKSMKCGDGKCGSGMKEEKAPMKCGAGKCGGGK
ncbi:cytochrome c [bacterium]|nr:cytochrome c [bacterium]MBU1957806.1 cytochrome c [bacterium]